MLLSEVSAKPYVEKGLLRRVLAGWSGPMMDFNAVFPRGQAQAPKIRAFVDFLVERLRFEVDYMRTACPDSIECREAMRAAAATSQAEVARAVARQERSPADAEAETEAQAA